MRATASPMIIISGTVNLFPRMILQSPQAVCTFPFTWGRALSILSSPRFSDVVPQYTHGWRIYSSISSAVRSQASILWYAFLRWVARPLWVWFHLFIRAFRSSFCSGVSADHLSFRRSLPFFRPLWHGLHSYDKPRGRDFSRWKFSGFAGRSFLQRKHVRYIIHRTIYAPHIMGQGGK